MSDITTKRGRKKAVEAPVVATVEVTSPAPTPATVAQPLMLTQAELHKLKLFEAEARAARADAESCRIRKKYFLALLDPKGSVAKEEERQEEHLKKAREWAKKHEIVIAHISMRLGLDLKECAFDPETGVVVPPDSATGSK